MFSIRKLTVAIVILVLSVAVLCGGLVYSSDDNRKEKPNFKGWPMFGHDPSHTGRSSFHGVDENPVIGWASEANLFAISKKGGIYAVRYRPDTLAAFTSEGQLKWDIAPHLEFTPALGPKGTIYGTADQRLVAVSPHGTREWEFEIAGEHTEIGSPPVVTSQGMIYFTVEDEGLYAIGTEGEKKWNFKTQIHEHSAPAVGPNSTVYIVGHSTKNYRQQNFLYAVTKEGKLKWKFPTGTAKDVDSTPSISEEGTIYFGSGDNLYAVSLQGNQKWVYKTGGKVGGRGAAPAIGPNRSILFGSDDGHFYAVNSDGTTKWIINTQGDEVGDKMPIVDVGGDVYVCFRRPGGAFLGALRPDGTTKWKLPLASCGSLAIGPGGNIYVGLHSALYSIGSCSSKTR